MYRNHVLLALTLAFALAACGQQPSVQPTAVPTAQPTTQPQPTKAATTPPTPAPKPTALPATTPAPIMLAQPASVIAPVIIKHRSPRRIVIDSIQLDYNPLSVGLDKQKSPIVPDHDVGWYNLSAGPGEGENIVLWGHVLRFRNEPATPAPFAHLKELKVGAEIMLYDMDGTAHKYVVRHQIWVTPDQVEYILPAGHEQLTLVSCIGDSVIADGAVIDKSHRLITIADPE